MTTTGETGTRGESGAVRRPVACGDIVRVGEGRRGVLAVVHAVDGSRVLIMVGAGQVEVAS